jgi:hypothetical protein
VLLKLSQLDPVPDFVAEIDQNTKKKWILFTLHFWIGVLKFRFEGALNDKMMGFYRR